MLATLSAFLFFGSVVLHELGHAVVARRNGIETHGIDLWLLGGLARLSRDSDSPGRRVPHRRRRALRSRSCSASCASRAGVALVRLDRVR